MFRGRHHSGLSALVACGPPPVTCGSVGVPHFEVGRLHIWFGGAPDMPS